MKDIKGTMQVQTLAMLWSPPTMTSPTMRAMQSPEIQLGTEKVSLMIEAMALDWTTFPVPMTAMAPMTAKVTAIQRQPTPRRMVYIGPPWTSPSSSLTRYLIASNDSAYLVAMPKMPVTMHQKTAPGPPRQTAVATPTTLPVPMVEASATERAAKGETLPLSILSRSTTTEKAVIR